MILVDTSALVAILHAEPEANDFVSVIEMNNISLPASSLVEANIVAVRRGLGGDLQRLLGFLSADVIALDESIALVAADAFRRYGKGRHKASLNFGDCLVYATAKHLHLPLLYKGNDFVHTDVKSVLQSRH